MVDHLGDSRSAAAPWGGSGADELHGGDGPDSPDASDGVRGNDAVYGGAG